VPEIYYLNMYVWRHLWTSPHQIDSENDGLDGGVVEKVVNGWGYGVKNGDDAQRKFH